MQDMDFSLGTRIIEILEQNSIDHTVQWSNGFQYIQVYNGDMLAMFIIYGFFEEYVIYENSYNPDAQWNLITRNELNFTSIASVLKLIGIEMSNE